MLTVKPNCIVGIPNQVLALVNLGNDLNNPEKNFIKSVLLSTDNVPKSILNIITDCWQCKVFNHYGMTEMGLGGGVDCQALYGYHLREADLFFEIVDPLNGLPAADGTLGEIVFTTLNREAMPLIRYKTGDLSYFRISPCPCGSMLRTMAPIQGRLKNILSFDEESSLSLGILDEVLFSFKDILDYEAILTKDQNRINILTINIKTNTDNIDLDKIQNALLNADSIRYIKNIKLELNHEKIKCFENTGTSKRILKDLRQHY
jgi:phenylacetate-coenzyme A ligase PaaK-like adenylate-forming protein